MNEMRWHEMPCYEHMEDFSWWGYENVKQTLWGLFEWLVKKIFFGLNVVQLKDSLGKMNISFGNLTEQKRRVTDSHVIKMMGSSFSQNKDDELQILT